MIISSYKRVYLNINIMWNSNSEIFKLDYDFNSPIIDLPN